MSMARALLLAVFDEFAKETEQELAALRAGMEKLKKERAETIRDIEDQAQLFSSHARILATWIYQHRGSWRNNEKVKAIVEEWRSPR